MSTPIAYRMTNGRTVHPECREAYRDAYAQKKILPPAIETGLLEGHPDAGKLTCQQCGKTIGGQT